MSSVSLTYGKYIAFNKIRNLNILSMSKTRVLKITGLFGPTAAEKCHLKFSSDETIPW